MNWIGLFFNTVLPGAVTGDLIKMFYLKQVDSNLSKTSMFLTVLMDRIYGLIGLITLMGIISLFRFNTLTSMSPGLEKIVYFNLILLLGVIIFFVVVFFFQRRFQLKIQESAKKIPVIGKKTIHLNECFWMMANEKKTLFKCIGSSLIAHNFGILAFFTITSPFYGAQINFLDIFSVVPIGMIITAIPISPGGLGVGKCGI